MTVKYATSTDALRVEELIDLRDLQELRDRLREDNDEQALSEEESELLAEIERFDEEEVNGDVDNAWSADSPTLIHESYWRTYAEEDANELVIQDRDDMIAQYFDYDRFAADYRQDFEEVTLAGETFLRRSF